MPIAVPEKLKKNWLILLINIVILSLYVIKIGFTLTLIAFELIFIILFYLKIIKQSSSQSSVTAKDGKLIVNGVFHRFEVEQHSICGVRYKRDLLAKVFDWDLMIIETSLRKTHIYIRRNNEIL